MTIDVYYRYTLTINNVFAATAHAPDHVTCAYGSKIITYLESPTPINCLLTVQVTLGCDD